MSPVVFVCTILTSILYKIQKCTEEHPIFPPRFVHTGDISTLNNYFLNLHVVADIESDKNKH